MLVEMKNKLDHPTVRKLVSESAWDKSAEAMDKKTAEFRHRKDLRLYGWIENGEILGVCGVVIRSNWVEICNIAVASHARKQGIGQAIVTALQKTYQTTIKAETDDDAVGFYQKCGFKTQSFIKKHSADEYRRYDCVLHIV